jgi:hypothetical protein
MNLDHLPWPTDGWGYMPPTDQIMAAFNRAQELYQPKRVLEIGFLWGHSSTYQLETYKDADIVCIGPLEEPNMSKEQPPIELRLEQIEKMKKKYGDRFTHIAGKTQYVQNDVLENFTNWFDFALIDGYHKAWAVEFDSTMCQDLGIKHCLIDNWDQGEVRNTVLKYTDYRPVEVFKYDQEWKGKNYVNEIALCTL